MLRTWWLLCGPVRQDDYGHREYEDENDDDDRQVGRAVGFWIRLQNLPTFPTSIRTVVDGFFALYASAIGDVFLSDTPRIVV